MKSRVVGKKGDGWRLNEEEEREMDWYSQWGEDKVWD